MLTDQGSFNWRIKFPLFIDQYSCTTENKNKYRVDFQIWDKDLVTSNDFLSSVTIDIWDMVEEAVRNECRVKKYMDPLKKKDQLTLETVWNKNLKDSKLQKSSKIKVSIEMVPKEE